MRLRFGVLYLGAVHARAQLERRGHIKRRPRTDYLWALRVGASSNLYRIIDDVRCDRDRARPRRRNYRDAVRVREPLDKIALRRKAHAQAVPRAVCGLSETREAHHSVHSLNCFNRNFGGLQTTANPVRNGSFAFGYDADRTIVLKQRGSHFFNAGASGFAQSSHYFMASEFGTLQSLLEKFAIADEHLRPSFDQSFQPFASISEKSDDPVDPDQGHC